MLRSASLVRETQTDREGERKRERDGELELENFILQGLQFRFSQKPGQQLVLTKLVMSKYKITSIIDIYIGMNE